jgi:hypothetical protein
LKNTYTLISPRSNDSVNDEKDQIEPNSEAEDDSEPPTLDFQFPEKYSDYDEEHDCIIQKPSYHKMNI